MTFSLSVNNSHFANTLAGSWCYRQKEAKIFDWYTPVCNLIKNLRFNTKIQTLGTCLFSFLDTGILFSFFMYLLFVHLRSLLSVFYCFLDTLDTPSQWSLLSIPEKNFFGCLIGLLHKLQALQLFILSWSLDRLNTLNLNILYALTVYTLKI